MGAAHGAAGFGARLEVVEDMRARSPLTPLRFTKLKRWTPVVLGVWVAVGALGALGSTTAQAQTLSSAETSSLNDGVFLVPSGETVQSIDSNLAFNAGFRVQERDLRAPFVISKEARKIFAANAHLREKMPLVTPKAFAPIVTTIFKYIEDQQKERAVSFEKTNGISNWALAIKITRLAFCFSTEPKGVAAQIQQESSYNRNRPSNTGAVGFTQLTGHAIDEVNDQLGNRGTEGAQLTNLPYLAQAVRCYTGGKPFPLMFTPGGAITRGQLVAANPKARAKAKAWIMKNVDRDLIYGQILLKVLLADAHDNGILGEAAYLRAFKRYNGEPKGRDKVYAREIVKTMRQI